MKHAKGSPPDHPLVFLSHAGGDVADAVDLAKRIECSPDARQAGLKVWVDARDLVAGDDWQGEIERQILERSTAFAVYVGRNGIVNWVDREVKLALDRAARDPGYRFIPLLSADASDPGELPGFVRLYHGVREIESNPMEFSKLIAAITDRGTVGSVRLTERPYPGLRAFAEEDSLVFFGRSDETKQLVELLCRHSLVIVVGDSGSGKSSMARAGVIHSFLGGGFPDDVSSARSMSDRIAIETRPRGEPLEGLASAVERTARLSGLGVARGAR